MVLNLVLINNVFAAGIYGRGEVKLSTSVVNQFKNYLRGGHNKTPFMFIISIDGNHSYYWYCPAGQANCVTADPIQMLKPCENASNQECKVFARNRTVRWKNDINPGKGKKSKFNSKMSDAEIKTKLTNLGFLERTTTALNETKYPESLLPADYEKKKQWDEYKKYDESKEWPFSAWSEVRSKKGRYSYQWTARKTLKEALKYSLDKCNERRQAYQKNYKKSEICIVHYLNGKETTDYEKIKYAEEYYGKELASKSFKKNSWILKNKSSLEKTSDSNNIVQQINDLKELYNSGVLTKEEFEKAKKKLLN